MKFNDLVKLVEQVGESFTYNEVKALIQSHEGIRPMAYLDSRKILTVGIGFNMERPDAREIFKQLNIDYDKVRNKQIPLTNEQIVLLFSNNLKTAINDAKKFIPSFDRLPKNVKLALVDLSFNLGYPNLSKFVKTKQYIEQGNYKEASREILRSKWASQVGRRSQVISGLLQSA